MSWIQFPHHVATHGNHRVCAENRRRRNFGQGFDATLVNWRPSNVSKERWHHDNIINLNGLPGSVAQATLNLCVAPTSIATLCRFSCKILAVLLGVPLTVWQSLRVRVLVHFGNQGLEHCATEERVKITTPSKRCFTGCPWCPSRCGNS